jgi:hypothetical protein
MVAGKPVHHPEAVYHLRYLRDRKRVWESVGNDAQEALMAQHRREAFFEAREEGVTVEDPTSAGRSLAVAIKQYLKEIEPARAVATHSIYEYSLRLFKKNCGKTTLEAIKRENILRFRDWLLDDEEGLDDSPRSAHIHMTSVKTFLNHFEIRWPLKKTDKIRIVEKEVRAYSGRRLPVCSPWPIRTRPTSSTFSCAQASAGRK